MRNLHCITLFALVLNFFALVLHILHSFLSQSESSNFFMCIISQINKNSLNQTVMPIPLSCLETFYVSDYHATQLTKDADRKAVRNKKKRLIFKQRMDIGALC